MVIPNTYSSFWIFWFLWFTAGLTNWELLLRFSGPTREQCKQHLDLAIAIAKCQANLTTKYINSETVQADKLPKLSASKRSDIEEYPECDEKFQEERQLQVLESQLQTRILCIEGVRERNANKAKCWAALKQRKGLEMGLEDPFQAAEDDQGGGDPRYAQSCPEPKTVMKYCFGFRAIIMHNQY